MPTERFWLAVSDEPAPVTFNVPLEPFNSPISQDRAETAEALEMTRMPLPDLPTLISPAASHRRLRTCAVTLVRAWLAMSVCWLRKTATELPWSVRLAVPPGVRPTLRLGTVVLVLPRV